MSPSCRNRGSRPAILLRESYRDGDKVKNRTLKNLSDWPAERIQLLRAVLRGETLVPAGEGLAIVRALPHGHVSAALGTARRIGLDRLLPRRPEQRRKLALALIAARLIDPRPSWRRRGRSRRRRRSTHSARPSGWAWSPPRRSTRRSTGWAGLSRRSRRRSPGAISRTAASSSTISPRAISRAAADPRIAVRRGVIVALRRPRHPALSVAVHEQ